MRGNIPVFMLFLLIDQGVGFRSLDFLQWMPLPLFMAWNDKTLKQMPSLNIYDYWFLNYHL